MIKFAENDYSPAAREVMAEASRAGVNRESVGQMNNLAARYERLGRHAEAAECQRKALEIVATWGSRHANYDAGTAENLARMQERLARCEAAAAPAEKQPTILPARSTPAPQEVADALASRTGNVWEYACTLIRARSLAARYQRSEAQITRMDATNLFVAAGRGERVAMRAIREALTADPAIMDPAHVCDAAAEALSAPKAGTRPITAATLDRDAIDGAIRRAKPAKARPAQVVVMELQDDGLLTTPSDDPRAAELGQIVRKADLLDKALPHIKAARAMLDQQALYTPADTKDTVKEARNLACIVQSDARAALNSLLIALAWIDG